MKTLETKPGSSPGTSSQEGPEVLQPAREANLSSDDREKTGKEKRLEHLQMLMLDELGNCLVKFDKFGDNPEAAEKCRKIAVQKAENRYMRGE